MARGTGRGARRARRVARAPRTRRARGLLGRGVRARRGRHRRRSRRRRRRSDHGRALDIRAAAGRGSRHRRRPSPRSWRSSCCRTAARCHPTWPRWSRSTARRVPTTATRSACWRRSVRSPGSADDLDEPGARAPTGDGRAVHAGDVRGGVAARGFGRRAERPRRAGGGTTRARDARRGGRPRLHRRGHDHVDDVEGAAVGTRAGERHRRRDLDPRRRRQHGRRRGPPHLPARPPGLDRSGGRAHRARPSRARSALGARHRRDPHRGGTSGHRGPGPPPDGEPAQRLAVDDATGLLLAREVLGPTAGSSARSGSRPSTSASAPRRARRRRRRPACAPRPPRS